MSVFDIKDDEAGGWSRRAACMGMDTEPFFPLEARDPAKDAKAVCRRCPVAAECLTANLTQRHGVFGGLTARERAAVRRGVPPRRYRPMGEPTGGSKCGTTAGYHQHERNRQRPCQPCYAAKAEYRRAKRVA